MTRRKAFAALAVAVLAAGPHCARADDEPKGRQAEIDTEHLFGFNTGSDVGEVGDREIENKLDVRFAKRSGGYAVLSPVLGYELVPVKNLRLEVSTSLAYHDISGVTGLDDRRQGAFQGLSFEMRYRLLDREHSAFGLTIGAEPHWGRVDETSGAPSDQYGIDLAILADRELVPDRLIGVFNLFYQPEAGRSRVTGEWTRESTLGGSAGLMLHVRPGFFVGAEARYLRRYDGLGLDRLEGHALFLGPMTFAKLTEHWWLSTAVSVQVAGRAVDEAGPLDLVNFERIQARFRLGYSF
jgi:hypothetical protein